MAIERLDHYTIRTANLEATRRFYIEIVGLHAGPRPPFDFPGTWLYSGDVPVVHLVRSDASSDAGSGAIDHVAFRATGLSEMRESFHARGIQFTERTVPMLNVRQVFVRDPNGIEIELNFTPELP